MTDYLPLSPRELGTRLPLSVVQKWAIVCPEQNVPVPEVGLGGVILQCDYGGDFRIKGSDREGYPWEVMTEFSGMGTAVWRRDLDQDGVMDLVLSSYTGGCGLAPTMVLTTIMFDPMGRPVPWAADGYYDEDSHGIRDLLDMDADGHAELVRMDYDQGYWITSLFEAQNGRWLQVKGLHSARMYPLFTRFTYRANHTPITPSPPRKPFEDQLGNTIKEEGSRVSILKLLNWEAHATDPLLEMSDGKECRLDYWHSTAFVVFDASTGRRAVHLSCKNEARKLVELAISAGNQVSLAGHRRPKMVPNRAEDCVPELVWIHEKSP